MNIAFLIEGPDDEAFILEVVRPAVFSDFNFDFYHHAKKDNRALRQYIRNHRNIGFDTYLFLHDHDKPLICNTNRKSQLLLKYPGVDAARLVLVVIEIESWYIAGVDIRLIPKGRRWTTNIEKVNKDKFSAIGKANGFGNTAAFRRFCLDNYDLELALSKSPSLRYLVGKIRDL
jgi:hypothetical protein